MPYKQREVGQNREKIRSEGGGLSIEAVNGGSKDLRERERQRLAQNRSTII
jgi:hypothetical protein